MTAPDELFRRLRVAGMSEREAERKSVMFAALEACLGGQGADERVASYFVPGRIEVLGKHTDYAGGRSLLCAAERGFAVAARSRDDPVVTVADTVSQSAGTFVLAADQRGTSDWRNYPATVVRRLAMNFGESLLGCDIAFASDLPRAAGLSSSTGLMLATFRAVSDRNRLDERDEWRGNLVPDEALAAYLGAMENGSAFGSLRGDTGVGTRGGSQDHTAILCARPGRLVQYRFAPTHKEDEIAVPAGHTFVVCASGIAAEKTGPARDRYNHAARAAEAILALWHQSRGPASTLGAAIDSTLDAREQLQRIVRDRRHPQFAADLLERRLQQFLEEAFELVPAAGRALRVGELAAFGDLVDQSQQAAERWLGNQVPETIGLARTARRLGAVAASAFGAGFGGSVWALVPAGDADLFSTAWRDAYARAFPVAAQQAQLFVTAAGPPWLQLSVS